MVNIYHSVFQNRKLIQINEKSKMSIVISSKTNYQYSCFNLLNQLHQPHLVPLQQHDGKK